MIQEANKLRRFISSEIKEKMLHRQALRPLNDVLLQYDFAEGNDYLTLRKSLDDANEFALFILLSGLQPGELNRWYTQEEIEYYSKEKWHNVRVEFPIEFDVIPVSDDQYIGRITAKELMLLKDAQIINYNENTQRTMKHMVLGEQERYQIYLNNIAINGIMELYSNGNYIPNTITLNIPFRKDIRAGYDEKRRKFIVEKAKYFDIIDGYHRYIGLSKYMMLNPEFDCQFELRIVRFDESRANQFIYQENLKTKMRKIDSDSMNQTALGTQVVAKLKQANACELSGDIGRNQGLIQESVLTAMINLIYFRKKLKGSVSEQVYEVKTEIAKKINEAVDQQRSLRTERWSEEFIQCFIYACSKCENGADALELANKLYNKSQKKNLLIGGVVTGHTIKVLDQLIEGV